MKFCGSNTLPVDANDFDMMVIFLMSRSSSYHHQNNWTHLISLLIASNCSWSIIAKVWASEWPLGERRSIELKIVSLSSSSISDISVSLSKGWLLSTPICWVLFHSWSPRDFTWMVNNYSIDNIIHFQSNILKNNTKAHMLLYITWQKLNWLLTFQCIGSIK